MVWAFGFYSENFRNVSGKKELEVDSFNQRESAWRNGQEINAIDHWHQRFLLRLDLAFAEQILLGRQKRIRLAAKPGFMVLGLPLTGRGVHCWYLYILIGRRQKASAPQVPLIK